MGKKGSKKKKMHGSQRQPSISLTTALNRYGLNVSFKTQTAVSTRQDAAVQKIQKTHFWFNDESRLKIKSCKNNTPCKLMSVLEKRC